MGYSFDPGLGSVKDRVRLRLQDTDLNNPAVQIFQDETIEAMLGMFSFDEACAQLCESAAAFFAQMADSVDNGPVKYAWRARVDWYEKLAVSIRSLSEPGPGDPIWTGATTAPMLAPNLFDYRTD